MKKVSMVKAMIFPVVIHMWELGHEEGWVLKNWCFWTVVLKKTWETLDCVKLKLVNPEGDQPWIFFGRTDAEAEAPVLWPPDVKRRLIGKDPDGGKDWVCGEKGVTDEGIINRMDMSLNKLWEIVMYREAWRAAVHGVRKHQTPLSD